MNIISLLNNCMEYYKHKELVNKDKIAGRKQNNYQEHREERLAYAKQCEQQNNERRCVMVECECGSSVHYRHKVKHDRSKKHKDFIASKNNETVTTPPL